MIENIDQSAIRILQVLYEKLLDSLKQANKKLVRHSVLLSILKFSNNDTYKIIRNSSQKFERIFLHEIDFLERENYVKKSDDKDKIDEIVITTHGIWLIETLQNKIELKDILNYLQETKFEFPKAKMELSDNEKVILYSMLAIRTFSEHTTMDLTSDELCRNWKYIIETKIIPQLWRYKIITINSVIDKKTGNEDPISYLLRHANDLPQKTNNLFVHTKRNKYYLAINCEDRGKSISQLTFLIKRVFLHIDSNQQSMDIYQSLCDIAHSDSLYVLTSFDLISNYWDLIIKDSIDQLFLGIGIHN